jgi:hypothetical protein
MADRLRRESGRGSGTMRIREGVDQALERGNDRSSADCCRRFPVNGQSAQLRGHWAYFHHIRDGTGASTAVAECDRAPGFATFVGAQHQRAKAHSGAAIRVRAANYLHRLRFMAALLMPLCPDAIEIISTQHDKSMSYFLSQNITICYKVNCLESAAYKKCLQNVQSKQLLDFLLCSVIEPLLSTKLSTESVNT